MFIEREIDYVILPGRPEFDRHDITSLYNEVYAFWNEFWSQVLKANGTEARPSCDDFMRQDLFSVLRHKGRVIGLHTYSLFDLERDSTRGHSYFGRYYTDRFFTRLAEWKATRLMTMEYFSIAPEWRSNKLGLSLAAVLAILGLKLGKELGIDATLGVARVDVGVSKLAQSLGAEVLEPGLDIYNTPCDLIAFPMHRIERSKHDKENKLADLLWSRRHDLREAPLPAFRSVA